MHIDIVLVASGDKAQYGQYPIVGILGASGREQSRVKGLRCRGRRVLFCGQGSRSAILGAQRVVRSSNSKISSLTESSCSSSLLRLLYTRVHCAAHRTTIPATFRSGSLVPGSVCPRQNSSHRLYSPCQHIWPSRDTEIPAVCDRVSRFGLAALSSSRSRRRGGRHSREAYAPR